MAAEGKRRRSRARIRARYRRSMANHSKGVAAGKVDPKVAGRAGGIASGAARRDPYAAVARGAFRLLGPEKTLEILEELAREDEESESDAVS
jgi:uncharacterized protein YjcR